MEGTVTRPRIRHNLIPDHVREDVCEVVFKGYMEFERHLAENPEEARRFNERVAEIKKRRLSRRK